MTTAQDIAMKRVEATMLKGHCNMMALGMNHSKISRTKMLNLAGLFLGKIYKRGQHKQAAEDLQVWLDANPMPSQARVLADQLIDAYDLDMDPVDMIHDELQRDPDQDLGAMLNDIAMKVSFP